MNLYELFLKPYETYTNFQIFLEATAAIFGLLSVYFSIKKNIWVYPTGTNFYGSFMCYILFNFGLLGDAMINVYYTYYEHLLAGFLWSASSEDNIHVEVFVGKL